MAKTILLPMSEAKSLYTRITDVLGRCGLKRADLGVASALFNSQQKLGGYIDDAQSEDRLREIIERAANEAFDIAERNGRVRTEQGGTRVDLFPIFRGSRSDFVTDLLAALERES